MADSGTQPRVTSQVLAQAVWFQNLDHQCHAAQDRLREGKFTARLRTELAHLQNEDKGNILSCLLQLRDCGISRLTLGRCENSDTYQSISK